MFIIHSVYLHFIDAPYPVLLVLTQGILFCNTATTYIRTPRNAYTSPIAPANAHILTKFPQQHPDSSHLPLLLPLLHHNPTPLKLRHIPQRLALIQQLLARKSRLKDVLSLPRLRARSVHKAVYIADGMVRVEA